MDSNNPNKPVFKHDCYDCVFLGHYNDRDLYFCADTVIARYGDNRPDYSSGMGFARPDGNQSLYQAKLLAIDKGLIAPGV